MPGSTRVKRFTRSVLWLMVLSQTTAGCETMSEQQKGGAVGAGAGAVLGGAAGALLDKKNPGRGAALGAAAGAVTGGVAGWAVGEYRVRQVRAREQAAAATGYTATQGVVARIEKAATTPQQLRPGEQLTFQAQYTVLGPPQQKEIRVMEARTIFFDNRHLVDLPQKELTLAQGTNEIQDSLKLPREAAEGLYLMMTSVTPAVAGAQKVEVATPFVVRTAAPVASAVPPPTLPAAAAATAARPPTVEAAVVPPAAQAPRIIPQALYVKIAAASIREGAGVRFKLLSQVPQGTKLQVLEAGGTEQDRWFKVKLTNGQEGWVAASAVSPSP
jgi:hypothetical protein